MGTLKWLDRIDPAVWEKASRSMRTHPHSPEQDASSLRLCTVL